MKKLILMSFILTSMAYTQVWAQDSDTEELNLIEMELDKSSTPVSEDTIAEPTQTRSSTPETNRPAAQNENKEAALQDLSDFKQVSVIQRRYLPRTGRFQAYIGPALTLNDPWFNVMGVSLKLGYNFTEALGIEGGYTYLSNDKTQALKELKKENNITTKNFVYTKSYYTIDLNWTPYYGKMTWLNEQILYYDIYFTAGFGGTEIQTGDMQSTIHLGAGQIFSITKAYAFRWDLTWNFFNAKQIDNKSETSYNNVVLSAGVSFFFPEALYR